MKKTKKLLFVCIENSCRSQMAEVFAKIHGKDRLEAHSAGPRPSGKVNEKAIKSMREIGYNLSVHSSKSLTAVPDVEYDRSITIGCGDECPYVKEKQRQDWSIPDPKNMNEQDFDKVRDTIETKVFSLIDSMNTEE